MRNSDLLPCNILGGEGRERRNMVADFFSSHPVPAAKRSIAQGLETLCSNREVLWKSMGREKQKIRVSLIDVREKNAMVRRLTDGERKRTDRFSLNSGSESEEGKSPGGLPGGIPEGLRNFFPSGQTEKSDREIPEEPMQAESQHLRCQLGEADPRKDEKSQVVCEMVQTACPLLHAV